MKATTKQSFLREHQPCLPSLDSFKPDLDSGRSKEEQAQELFCRSSLLADLNNVDWKWLPTNVVQGQATIEAALLALSCFLNKYEPPLRILYWLKHVAHSPIVQTTKVPKSELNPNNWSWSRLFLRTYLNKIHGYHLGTEVDKHNVLTMSRNNGLFLDGQVFDYYCGWDMQFWPHFYSMLVPEEASYWAEKAMSFLPRYAALFDVDSGKNFAFGRSQHYGYAAASPFVACWFNPAYVGPSYYNLVAKNVAYHSQHSVSKSDWYASEYSWLICGKTHLARLLPDDSLFWGASANEWQQQSQLDKFTLTPKSVSPCQLVVDGQLIELDTRYLTCLTSSQTQSNLHI